MQKFFFELLKIFLIAHKIICIINNCIFTILIFIYIYLLMIPKSTQVIISLIINLKKKKNGEGGGRYLDFLINLELCINSYPIPDFFNCPITTTKF